MGGVSAGGNNAAERGGTAGSAAGGSGGMGGQGGAPPALEPGLRWLGRVDKTATGARFSWPGTGFTARFNGTAARVSLKTDQVDYFQLVVDAKLTLLTTQAGAHDYDLAQNLAAGEHTVVLWRRTEPLNGSAEITKIDFLGGTLLSPPPPSNKRLEIVGDSITVGYGVECKTIGEQFAYLTENNYQNVRSHRGTRPFGRGGDDGLVRHRRVARRWAAAWLPKCPSSTCARSQPGRQRLGFCELHARRRSREPRYERFRKGDPGKPFVDAYVAFVTGVRGRYPPRACS